MTASQTSQDGQPSGFAAASDMFSKMWTDFASKMAAGGMTAPPSQGSPEMARQMRDMFFKSWSEACDRYMRSEEFRQMMRESMQAAIELRKQLNEQFGDLQHNLQGASRQDVDRLVHGVEQLEDRVTETFEKLMDRLDDLAQRLDAFEGQGAATTTKKTTRKKSSRKAAPRKKTSKKSSKRSGSR